MSLYLWIKLLHIVSATILFGTGLGIAYFMLKAYLSGNEDTMAITTRNVVLADWIFTTPAVAIQLASGLWLTRQIGISFDSVWFVLVAGLFVLVGACWIPVVRIQIRIRDVMADKGNEGECRRLMKSWMILGAIAFACVLALFYLMVFKVGIGQPVFS